MIREAERAEWAWLAQTAGVRGFEISNLNMNDFYGAGFGSFFDCFFVAVGRGYHFGQTVVSKSENVGTDVGAYAAAYTAVAVKFKLHEKNLL